MSLRWASVTGFATLLRIKKGSARNKKATVPEDRGWMIFTESLESIFLPKSFEAVPRVSLDLVAPVYTHIKRILSKRASLTANLREQVQFGIHGRVIHRLVRVGDFAHKQERPAKSKLGIFQ